MLPGGSKTRLAVAGLASILALLFVTAAVATVLARTNPAIAHQIAPWNGRIASEYALESFTRKPEVAASSRPAMLAKQALRADATAVDGLIVLAFQAQLRGDQPMSDAIFATAARLSRRELRTHVWTIEKAVQRGDIEGALQGYDLALRTSREASNLLYPVLARAIAEPKVRSALVFVLQQRPPWAPSFLEYAAEIRAAPAAARQLFEQAEAVEVPVTDKARAALVDALAADGRSGEAWNYFRRYRSQADARRSRDPRFDRADEHPSVFDWKLAQSEGVVAELLPDRGGNVVDIRSVQGAGGVAVSQLQVLPPGRYLFRGEASGTPVTPASRPYWQLRCTDGPILGTAEIVMLEEGPAAFRGQFTVPQRCDAQSLELVLKPSAAIDGVALQLHRAELVSVSGTPR